jgi:glycosyltransferase involved in cell wall biosynthesis
VPFTEPIHVLFIRDHLARTGGTTYLLETLAQLDPARVRSSVCVLQPRSSASRDLEQLGVYTAFLNRAKRDPRRLADLDRILRETDADVLHLLGPKSFLWGRLLARRHRLPAIPHFHSMLPEPPMMAPVQRRLSRWTIAALSPSYAVRDWAAREYALPRDRIHVIYNGHDAARFAAAKPEHGQALRRELGIAADAPVIGLIGRVHTVQKGQDVMIRLMPQLLKRLPLVVLLVVGDGPDLGICRRLARQAGVEHAVLFTGYRTDIPEILSVVDVAVVPSVCDEGYPYVALEAAAAGRPVVAFRSGGLPEAVLDGGTGIVVPKGDVERLRDAIAELLSNRELALRLGEQGRLHAARFSLEDHARRLTDIYDRVLSEARAGIRVSAR